MPLQIKRIYEPAQDGDGVRVLVDRLWPRGISKDKANLDEWAKELAPSTELREWFGHRPERFDEFSARYKAELDANPPAQKDLEEILEKSKGSMVTLLYGAKDPQINQAVVLKEYLEEKKKLSSME